MDEVAVALIRRPPGGKIPRPQNGFGWVVLVGVASVSAEGPGGTWLVFLQCTLFA
jgi:hypothetical protein